MIKLILIALAIPMLSVLNHKTFDVNIYLFYLFKSFTVQSTDGPLVSCTSGQNYTYMSAYW